MQNLIQRGEDRLQHRDMVQQRSRNLLGLVPIVGEVVTFRRTTTVKNAVR